MRWYLATIDQFWGFIALAILLDIKQEIQGTWEDRNDQFQDKLLFIPPPEDTVPLQRVTPPVVENPQDAPTSLKQV